MRLGNIRSSVVPPTDMTKLLAGTVESSMSVRSQLIHFKLNQQFPKRIREVQLRKNYQDARLYALVHFENGHTAEGPECDVLKTEFLALCAMLYDLPPKEK